MNKICLIGFGSWGKAILKVIRAANSNSEITICTRQNANDVLSSVKCIIGNTDNIRVSFDIPQNTHTAIISVKAQEVLNVIEKTKNAQLQNCIITSKGFASNGMLLCEAAAQDTDCHIGVLAGPNFSSEILNDKLSVATLACATSTELVSIFCSENFRVMQSHDVIGVQVCSIFKNIYAIGCGVVAAACNSENTSAAFITSALSELQQAIKLFGGNESTILTPAGVGDLILTCYSKTSRNHMFGEKFVKNELQNDVGTVEGYTSLCNLNINIRGELPLCDAIYNLVHKIISVQDFIQILRK